LQQLVADAIDNLKLAKNNDAVPGDASGELLQLKGKLKRLVLLGVLGWGMLLAGLVLLLLR
jgi:hypothetical protein